MDSRTVTRIGSLVAAGGIVWTADAATRGFTNLQALLPLRAGPLELCGLGVIIWLLGKWRSSIRFR